MKIIVIIVLMFGIDFSGIQLKLKTEGARTYVYDPVRKKWLLLTPEEHVRQYLLQYYIHQLQYPAGLIAVEKNVTVAGLAKRFDIVVYNRDHQPWLLTECKAPEVLLNDAAFQQLLRYHNSLQVHYLVLSNGHTNFCADVREQNPIRWLNSLPGYDS